MRSGVRRECYVRTPFPFSNRPPPAESDRNRMEWNCVDCTLSSVPHRTPNRVPQRTPFPHRAPISKSTKQFKCNVANIWKNYVVQHRNVNTATSHKYIVQHRKTCTATSEKYVLQQRKLCTATSKIMYYNISNSSTATSQNQPMKHVNHLLQQPKKSHCNIRKSSATTSKKTIVTRRK